MGWWSPPGISEFCKKSKKFAWRANFPPPSVSGLLPLCAKLCRRGRRRRSRRRRRRRRRRPSSVVRRLSSVVVVVVVVVDVEARSAIGEYCIRRGGALGQHSDRVQT